MLCVPEGDANSSLKVVFCKHTLRNGLSKVARTLRSWHTLQGLQEQERARKDCLSQHKHNKS